ncbi:MAG: hypothetical protein ACYSR4_04675 [Planctomycetota bacterium]
MARRRGSDRFVVKVRADTTTQFVSAVYLDFLVPAVYCIRLYRDGTEGKEIAVEEPAVRTTEGLKIAMAQTALPSDFQKERQAGTCQALETVRNNESLNLRGDENEARRV